MKSIFDTLVEMILRSILITSVLQIPSLPCKLLWIGSTMVQTLDVYALNHVMYSLPKLFWLTKRIVLQVYLKVYFYFSALTQV